MLLERNGFDSIAFFLSVAPTLMVWFSRQCFFVCCRVRKCETFRKNYLIGLNFIILLVLRPEQKTRVGWFLD